MRWSQESEEDRAASVCRTEDPGGEGCRERPPEICLGSPLSGSAVISRRIQPPELGKEPPKATVPSDHTRPGMEAVTTSPAGKPEIHGALDRVHSGVLPQ